MAEQKKRKGGPLVKIREAVKHVSRRIAPSLYETVRFHRFCSVTFGPFQKEIEDTLFNQKPIHVLSGPFSGLRYFNGTVWGPITPKWLGTYEAELHGVVEEILNKEYNLVIDVGSAEGYYACGLARAMPDTQIYAFDVDRFARLRLRQLSRLNELRNIRIGKECSHERLNALIVKPSLLVCDIEGFEVTLLDPVRASSLLEVDVLVEIHSTETLDLPAAEQLFRSRFENTHSIVRVGPAPRDPVSLEKIPGLKQLKAGAQLEAANEYRSGEQAWLWMKTR